jgi:hypothetical protein
MNPYIDLTDKQIEQKITETHSRLSMAYSLGNQTVIESLNDHKNMLQNILAARKEPKVFAEYMSKSKQITSNDEGIIISSKSEAKQKPKKTSIPGNTEKSFSSVVWNDSPSTGEQT